MAELRALQPLGMYRSLVCVLSMMLGLLGMYLSLLSISRALSLLREILWCVLMLGRVRIGAASLHGLVPQLRVSPIVIYINLNLSFSSPHHPSAFHHLLRRFLFHLHFYISPDDHAKPYEHHNPEEHIVLYRPQEAKEQGSECNKNSNANPCKA